MTYKIVLVGALALAALPSAAGAMANPASVFCHDMGGRSVTARLPHGDEIALCALGDRQIVEEWTLYRMFDGRKPKPADNPFRRR